MTPSANRNSIWLEIGLFLTLCPVMAQQPATLDRTEVPAAGSQKVLLTISQFGRYSIATSSEEGTALQLVDRMAGPGAVSGKPGEENGRLDVFLDRGEYRILTSGHPGATGKANIVVRPFTEKSAAPPSLLVDFREVESSLGDFEQRSYWIEVKQQRRVLIEAAGRSLGDLRLWKDGKWLVDTTPATQVVQPRPGRPLLVCQLSADLDPGLYLLTAYGRPAQPWAEDSQEYPLYLRSGIPRFGLAMRKRFISSRFGVDRFLVPGRANYFRIELPAAAPALLGVAPFDPQNPFNEQRVEAQISKKSVPPVAELSTGTQENDHIVTVKAEPGQAYVLQYFEHLEQPTLQGHGVFWLSTTHLGHPGDSPDVSGLLVENRPDGQRRLVAGQGLEVGLKTAWKRRMNLLSSQQLFLEVKEAGDYLVAAEGIPVQFRIEPFLLSRPANYRAPEFRASGASWKLGTGWHVLTIQPDRKGVLDLTIRSNTWLDYALSATGLGGQPSPGAARAAVRFPQVPLQQGSSYTLFMTGGGPYGTIVRPLPLDLSDPLALAVEPAAEVEVPFRAAEAGVLRAEAEDGTPLEVSVDRGAWEAATPVEPGSHTAKVRHSRPETICFSLFVQPRRLDPASAPPSLSAEALATIPDFPVLSDSKPQFLDLGRRLQATFIVNATRPGLYQLESTGLLATKGVLRSRTVPAYAAESENGTGRNFSLRQYLTQADYQLSVATLGESAGHLGVQFKRTSSMSGGFLTSSVPARISLPAAQSVTYYFKITNRAEFRVRAFGAGRTLRCRLEDNDGWPLVPPGGEADITQVFDPGTYRLIILPEMTSARVIASVEPIRRPRIYQGRGPHTIPLARTVQAVWMEPSAGQERLPDVWEFTLPAASEVSIQLSGEMQAVLRARGSQTNEKTSQSARSQVVFVPPERGWRGPLAAGSYSLEVVSTRVNNRAPYRLAVSPIQLMTGMSREVNAPGQVPISVGEPGTIELWSFGNTDVRGRLYDGDGNLLASNDDRTNDWNFQIVQSLNPGGYSLKVDPVGVEKAVCTVGMRKPDLEEKGELTLPFRQEVTLGRRIVGFPIRVAADANLLTLRASARDSLGLSLEADFGQGWQPIGTRYGLQADLLVPVAVQERSGQPRYRLSLWSLDQRPTVATVSLQSAVLPAVAENQLADGLPLTAIPDNAFAFACVRVDRPGVFQTDSTTPDLLWSGDPANACAPAENRLVVAKPGILCVAARPKQGNLPLAKARRLALQAGAGTYLYYRHGMTLTCDLPEAGPGPVLLRAIATTGQPGVKLAGAKNVKAGSKWVVADHAAMAASLGSGNTVGEFWSAAPSDDALVVRVEPFHFAEPQSEAAPPNGDGEVAAQSARRFTLGAGWKRVSLSLGPGLVALLSRQDEIQTLHWCPGEPLFETLDTEAEQIYLLNPEGQVGRFALEALPLAADQAFPALSWRQPYEREHTRPGVERLRVPSGMQGAVLRVRGGEGASVFISSSGKVVRGDEIALDGTSGEVQIAHGTGPVICWFDRNDSDDALWPESTRSTPTVVEPPSVVTLSGQTSRVFQFKRSSPCLVHFRSSGPMLTTVRRPSTPPETELHRSGADLSIYVPEGTSELLVRGLAHHSLAGQGEFKVTSLARLDEGLGPELLLSPGDSRLFAFEVVREGAVGLGVRAESEVVELQLLSADGKALEKGNLLMPRLNPGTYLLSVKASLGSRPVKARPVVVGLRLPDSGPPEEVIQQYLRPTEEAPSFRARSADEVEEPVEEEESEPEEPAEEPPGE